MSHERFREFLALGLYDELSADESAELDAHLEECEACRVFAGRMEGIVQALASKSTRPAASDLPEGWSEQLRSSIAGEPRARARITTLAASISSFAAGLLLMWMLQSGPAPAERSGSDPSEETAVTAFERETPPPRANVRGTLARLGDLLRNAE